MRALTLLREDIQALLDQQRSIEDNQPVAERQDIVARAHLEEGANGTLQHTKSHPSAATNSQVSRSPFPVGGSL